jgi:hypothetical protein
MGKFSICSVVMLVVACAATPSFAAGDDGALKSNNIVTVAVEKGHAQPNADLQYLIGTITEHQSKKVKVFQRKAKAYFFKDQKAETIEAVTKQFPPGEAVAVIVLSNISKKPVREIIDLKIAGMAWEDIAEQSGVKVKALVSDVKDFRFGIG